MMDIERTSQPEAEEILPEGEGIPTEDNQGSGTHLSEDLTDLIQSVVIAIALFLLINLFTARVIVEGNSMLPTLKNGNMVIVSRFAYIWGEIEYGDVVVFPYPNYPQDEYVKRIIGLPGDKIKVENGSVYRNDVPLEEPYIAEPPVSAFEETRVPAGYVFVMGDNRNYSSDSRSWGALSEDALIGKVVFIYWPLKDTGILQSH